MSLEYNYTITSSDYNNYSTIRTNLKAPPTNKCEFMISTLTTTCNFTILNSEDYIHFILYKDVDCLDYYDSIIYFPRTVTGLNRYSFMSIMNEMMRHILYFYSVSDIGPLDIMCDRPFAIKDMSYRMKLVTGMYNNTFNNHEYNYVFNYSDKQSGIITPKHFLFVIIGAESMTNLYELHTTKDHILDSNDLSTYEALYKDMFSSIPDIVVEVEDKWLVDKGIRTLLKLNKPFRIHAASPDFVRITGLKTIDRENDYYPQYNFSIPGIKCSNQSGFYYILEKPKFNDIKELIIVSPEYDNNVYTGDYIEIVERNYRGIEVSRIKYIVVSTYEYNRLDKGVILDMLRSMIPFPDHIKSIYDFGIYLFEDKQIPRLKDQYRVLINETGAYSIFSYNNNFEIIGITENISRVTGLHKGDKSKPLYSIRITSTSYYQLTPVIYLVSNIGNNIHCYTDRDEKVKKVLMRINNFFIHNFPIVCSNFEFTSTIDSNDLSNVEFQLVDANFQPIILHSPMYLSAIAIGT